MQGMEFPNEQYFNPRNIGGLVLWLDGSDPSANGVPPSNGTAVSAWVDKSTKGNDGSQGTGANQPVFNANQMSGKGALTFTATKYMTTGTSGFPTGSAARTCFCVVRSTSTTTLQYIYLYGTTALDQYWAPIINSDSYLWIDTDGHNANSTTTSLANNANYILELNYTAGGTVQSTLLTVNGISQTVNPNSPGTPNTVIGTGLVSSSGVTGTLGFIGQIAEILLFDTALSASNATLVRTYLQNKWFFTPQLVPGLVLWLDGNDPDATGIQPGDGSSVSTWVDKSPKGNDATQGTGANQPVFNTNQINNNGILTFSSATKGMAYPLTGFPSGASARTMFVVCNTSAASTGGYTLNYGTFAADQLFGLASSGGGSPTLYIDIGGTTANSSTTTITNSTNYILEVNYSSGNIVTSNMVVNGIVQSLVNGASPPNTVNSTGQIGSLFGTGFGWIGQIAELIVYNSSISATNQSLIRRYLSSKWGVPITPFVPTDISGLVLWLDANDPSGNGTQPANSASLATWVDKSGTGNNAVQNTGANQPVFVLSGLNSLPSLQSTISTTMVSGTTSFPTGSGARTVFIVMQSSIATTGFEVPFQYGSGAFQTFSGGIFTANIICAINTAFSTGNTALSNNTAYIVELNYAAGGTLSTVAGRVNGISQTMGVTGTNAVLNSNTSSPNIFQGISGYCNEIIYYNTALSVNDSTQVREYLASKWGISI